MTVTTGVDNRFSPDSRAGFVEIGGTQPGAGAGGTITLDPNSEAIARFTDVTSPDQTDSTRPLLDGDVGGLPAVAVHEGTHALDSVRGQLDFDTTSPIGPINKYEASTAEARAIDAANKYRQGVGSQFRRPSYEADPPSSRMHEPDDIEKPEGPAP